VLVTDCEGRSAFARPRSWRIPSARCRPHRFQGRQLMQEAVERVVSYQCSATKFPRFQAAITDCTVNMVAPYASFGRSFRDTKRHSPALALRDRFSKHVHAVLRRIVSAGADVARHGRIAPSQTLKDDTAHQKGKGNERLDHVDKLAQSTVRCRESSVPGHLCMRLHTRRARPPSPQTTVRVIRP
jgi:hypothetical protein